MGVMEETKEETESSATTTGDRNPSKVREDAQQETSSLEG